LLLAEESLILFESGIAKVLQERPRGYKPIAVFATSALYGLLTECLAVLIESFKKQ
jgi:hypothetical protein